jgi:acyl-CoA thioesterase
MKENDYFRELLGITVIDVKDGYAKTTLTIAKQHLNIHGSAHGGAIFSLADCAFAEATNFGESKAVAVQASISFVKPCSEGDTLVAEASRVSEGKTFALYNIAVRKGSNVVALFTGLAYKLPPRKQS